MVEKIFDRGLRTKIIKFLPDREAIVILGARQTGKTTLLRLLQKEIQPPGQPFCFDLENSRHLEILNSGPEELIQYLKISGANLTVKNYLLIDEVQYLSNPSKFIKLMVDHYSNKFKLILTGSSALLIKMKFKDSLVGRKLVFNLYPLSFREFLIFKNEEKLASLLPDNPFIQKDDPGRFFSQDYQRYLQEFLIYGGFPRVALEADKEKKIKVLGEIVDSYIYQDIRSLFRLKDIAKFNQLVKILAAQSSGLLNIQELSKSVGLPRATISNYLTILQDTYILALISPYFTNKKKEVVKSPKAYFLDTGLRNYLIGNLSFSSTRDDIGRLLENLALASLLKRKEEGSNLCFWRAKNGTEVDFIIQEDGHLFPLEIKRLGKSHRGLLSFLKRYKVERGYIAHQSDFKQEAKFTYLPIWWL
ncbi:MAG: hypothetical protein CO162_02630 [bacterium (Candidatus Ratteibacteria) CG_4_9_14_3_um_filter_41_21]|uniref:ATPase n=2 Tax=Candidatus Ratteibacteria TaxID=2979319 RepID=A0A2M7EAL9_9BACT|nr:MAG: hypothetical protein AUJ76_00090 [Candidatus Omnitrophica bacterium CG1_02_41_171]PIV64796.1 MAG: hypothetical protein COS11_00315 [bacterium (Candidatus Ratteibacteria) CG01_land_8_20_14_3_00_40_19]PJA62141.1 MAG: hypothetical protein CO162_02630 [bacterium (Candidatus Ratteibacteria) CG_4_9_14_3_um_filter_41_21]HCG76518.1 hypothetical protein [bacterium]